MRRLRSALACLALAWSVALALAALVPAWSPRACADPAASAVREGHEHAPPRSLPPPAPSSPRYPAQGPDLSIQAPRTAASTDRDCPVFADAAARPAAVAVLWRTVRPDRHLPPPAAFRLAPAGPRAPPRA